MEMAIILQDMTHCLVTIDCRQCVCVCVCVCMWCVCVCVCVWCVCVVCVWCVRACACEGEELSLLYTTNERASSVLGSFRPINGVTSIQTQ